MARKESRTHTSIWSDEAFCRLSAGAQRAYWLAYSQPTIALTGVLPLTPGRWARFACDTDTAAIETALEELESAGFIVLDYATEELFVRSFIRWDGVWRNQKTRSCALEQAGSILSPTIRAAWDRELARIQGEPLVDTPSHTPSHAPWHAPWHAPSDAPWDGVSPRAHADSVSDSVSDNPPNPQRAGGTNPRNGLRATGNNPRAVMARDQAKAQRLAGARSLGSSRWELPEDEVRQDLEQTYGDDVELVAAGMDSWTQAQTRVSL